MIASGRPFILTRQLEQQSSAAVDKVTNGRETGGVGRRDAFQVAGRNPHTFLQAHVGLADQTGIARIIIFKIMRVILIDHYITTMSSLDLTHWMHMGIINYKRNKLPIFLLTFVPSCPRLRLA